MSEWKDTTVKKLKPRASAYRVMEDAAAAGFGLKVYPSGRKVFIQQYFIAGRRQFYTLGSYPDISLGQARKRAGEIRGLVALGHDPRTYYDEQVARRRRAARVTDLAAAYLDDYEAQGRSDPRGKRLEFEHNVLPVIGERLVAEVEAADITRVLRPIHQRGAHTRANRIRSSMSAMFTFGLYADNDPRSAGAVRYGLKWNPVSAVPKDASAERVDDRVLSWAELRQIWHAPEIPWLQRMALRLIVACGGPRVHELVGTPLAELDFKRGVWELEPARIKARNHHVLPLSNLMRELFEEVIDFQGDSAWLFPARNAATATKAWSNRTLGQKIRRLLTAEVDENSGQVVRPARLNMAHWTPEQLRGTCKTRMGEVGIDKQIRDRIQNHALQDVSSKHYDRYDYLAEKAAALNAWENALRERVIAGGDEGY